MKGNISKLIGERIRDARDSKGVKQDEMADFLGIKDRQTISSIERGERKVTSEELIRLMEFLGKPLEYFTDPFLITQTEIFSWRIPHEAEAKVPAEYEEKAKKIIASYREFSKMLGKRISALSLKMQITKQSGYEEVENIAEFLVQEWELSEVPYENLRKVLEEKLHIPVLYVDAPKNVSGASCRLDDLNCILINRNEPIGRQSYNLAHEFFHLMTWDIFPPKTIDQAQPKSKPKGETLADVFAAALLMPRESIVKYFKTLDTDKPLLEKLGSVASRYHVSVAAAYWRLVLLKQIQKIDKEEYDSSIKNRFADNSMTSPPLYSKGFAEILNEAIHRGLVSVRKAMSLLECSENDMEKLFSAYKLKGLYE
ncbi:MAG: XRE family transcriptional regulator [Victivallales bacterium]|jgi:Zn-dependent peptidase ImmA (M78 family)/DNA-binding XRE family transcriptional regulator